MAKRSSKALKSARAGLLGTLMARAAAEMRAGSARLQGNAEIVREGLKRLGLGFFESDERKDDGVVCAYKFRGSIVQDCDGVLDTYIWWIRVMEDCIGSRFRLPLHVPSGRRLAVAEFLMRANLDRSWGFQYGHFMIDIDDDGSVLFDMTIPSSVLCADDPYAEVGQIIDAPRAALGIFADGVIGVLHGHEPIDAFEYCMKAAARRLASRTSDLPLADLEDEVYDDAASNDDDDPAQKAEVVGNIDDENIGVLIDVDASNVTKDYTISGLNVKGDVSLEKVVDAVCRFRAGKKSSESVPRLNILLSGPSGCGKSEFVKYLGKTAGAKVLAVSASDVLDPMVGRTEQKLARVFRRAKATNSILFLDEVDSLLGSRKMAMHNWECCQTNELLQQMEKFGGVLVGATNFEKYLDGAVARRFTFKVQLDYLTAAGKQMFFKHYFKTSLSQDEAKRLEDIPRLTVGDFRTVREKLFYLSSRQTNSERLAALEAESDAKEKERPRVGF